MTQTEMRGLSLFGLSPLAIVYGAKTIETRSWQPPAAVLGQRIAIHASKTRGPGGLWELGHWMQEDGNVPWLTKAGYIREEDDGMQAHPEELPRGAIVGTAVLSDCRPTEELAPLVSELEWSHGDFSEGRYGWVLTKVLRLKEPVPHLGSLGLWKVSADTLPLVSGKGTRVQPIPSPINSHRPTPRVFSR